MMKNWINSNKRENRQKHNYKLSDYGLTDETISNKFKDYIKTVPIEVKVRKSFFYLSFVFLLSVAMELINSSQSPR